MTQKELYSQIEYLIIVWNNDGNKTAGSLTREIMELLTKKDYDKYIKVVNQNIKETERRMETLDMLRKVSQLSFEDWVKFQNKELTIK